MLTISNKKVLKLQKKFYPHLIDPDAFYYEAVHSTATPESAVLDLGAGKGELFNLNLRGQVKKVIGVDLDPGVLENPSLDEAIVHSIEEMPFIDDACMDLVVSRYVMEHIENPRKLFREIERILKPGGRFIFLTPNRWHYFFLASVCTPLWLHKWINEKRGIDESDTFKTWYRCNSINQIKSGIRTTSLAIDAVGMIESDPRYLIMSPFMFMIGVLYERMVNTFEMLRHFRINILCTLIKR